jgi:hypothetical protein
MPKVRLKSLSQQIVQLGSRLSKRVWPIVFLGLLLLYGLTNQVGMALVRPNAQLLTDPFLQLPTVNSVRVVWFTEFAGMQHFVDYGETFDRRVTATTTKLSRSREDSSSRWSAKRWVKSTPSKAEPASQTKVPIDPKTFERSIWRHEANVTGLSPKQRLPYRVTSVLAQGQTVTSRAFTLAANPAPGQGLKILLTSDHQLKPMVAANLQKVQETIGRVDGVFAAGDLINVSDRASEWFDDGAGGAFFPALQGRASYELGPEGQKTIYRGGELIQHAPLFAAIGNHEVMGRFSMTTSLSEQYVDAVPRSVASDSRSDSTSDSTSDSKANLQQLKNESFNTDTYEEIFTFPDTSPGGKQYYAVTFGDVRLVVLYATNKWQPPGLEAARTKYREADQTLNSPKRQGHGQFIFEPILKGSPQYKWLTQELNSAEFKQAKYKVVMFHHPPHSLGDNVVPAYTDPLPIMAKNADGQVKSLRYEYPKATDYLIRDVVPLLERSGVQLVFYGHSHLWNRFVNPQGMHFLESSNVGNSYGAYVDDKPRNVPTNAQAQQILGEPLAFPDDYAVMGDPYGLQPIVPTIAPLKSANGKQMPYIASNDITVFSILDTGKGDVTSYRFDTREPKQNVIKFDQFELSKP